jgi:dipeptidyl aminopeptidase/acylaminoacyl peptidase
MRIGVALSLVLLVSACGSSSSKPETPLHVSTFELQSKLLGKQLDQVLVTPQGGGKGRPLLVFLHGYGGAPADTLSPALVAALRRLGDRAPAVVLPDGQVGWWHDRDEGRWGSYVLDEVIPAALARTGADPDRVAVGGISMGGFGALNLGRHRKRFCAVGGHSPAVFERGNDAISFGFDNAADFAHNDLLGIARKRSPYDAPVWIDVGGQDELRPADALLARELRARGADVSFHVWPGNHDGDYWNRHFAQYVQFYVDACS